MTYEYSIQQHDVRMAPRGAAGGAVMIRLHLGVQQLSAVQINIADPAHDIDRETWWPTLDGDALAYDDANRDAVWQLLVDAANSEDAHAEERQCRHAAAARDALTRLAARVSRHKRQNAPDP